MNYGFKLHLNFIFAIFIMSTPRKYLKLKVSTKDDHCFDLLYDDHAMPTMIYDLAELYLFRSNVLADLFCRVHWSRLLNSQERTSLAEAHRQQWDM